MSSGLHYITLRSTIVKDRINNYVSKSLIQVWGSVHCPEEVARDPRHLSHQVLRSAVGETHVLRSNL